MTVTEIQNFLKKASESGVRPGLDRMIELCHRLGDPQVRVPSIHVAGTNGKGSTSAYMASILSCAGKKVGWYSSPAVIDRREPFRILNREGTSAQVSFREQVICSIIDEDTYCEILSVVIPAAQAMEADGLDCPTVYELETAAAFVLFAREEVDIAIIEVGMGGAGDATNVLSHTLVSVITPIGLDHMQYLGSSISQIAGEKARIITPGGKAVTYQPGIRIVGWNDPRAVRRQERNRGMILGRIRSEAEDKQATLVEVDGEDIRIESRDLSGTVFVYRDQTYRTEMCGTYQPANAALAIEAMRVLSADLSYLTPELIAKGIEQAVMPARFDIISRDPLVIYDGAHNPDGTVALTESVKALLPDRRIYGVMGIYKDKAVDEMLSHILPVLDRIVTVSAPGERGMAAGPLAEHVRYIRPDIPVEIGSNIRAVYESVTERARNDGAAVLVFGTLSLASEIFGMIYSGKKNVIKTISSGGKTDSSSPDTRILDALTADGVTLTAPCGGRGECGKCAVRVVAGETGQANLSPVTEAERNAFSEEQLCEGWRLACRTAFHGELTVEIPAIADESM